MYLGGNGEVLEATFDGYGPLAQQLGANLVAYNPKGVGRSSGTTLGAEDLVDDAHAVLEHLIKRYDIKEDKLMMLGHSLGGGIAARRHYR